MIEKTWDMSPASRKMFIDMAVAVAAGRLIVLLLLLLLLYLLWSQSGVGSDTCAAAAVLVVCTPLAFASSRSSVPLLRSFPHAARRRLRSLLVLDNL